MIAPDATSPRRMLARGARRRCARCGSGGLFRGFTMVERCPGCDLRFEREEGYWTGAIMVNLAVTEAVFLITFVTLIVLMWPDVNWGLVLAVVVAANVVVPIVFYPFAKTLWVAGDLAFRTATEEP